MERNSSEIVATRDSWKIFPMPEIFTTIRLDVSLNAQQTASIRQGFIPVAMEEKWFAYFENNILFQHRSWTGFCIDQIHFIDDNDGLRATHAEVNRDSDQYSETDNEVDRQRIEEQIINLANFDRTAPHVDSMVTSMKLAMQPNYLGSPEVVWQAALPFFDKTIAKLNLLFAGKGIRAAAEEADIESQRLVNIFSGSDSNYTTLSSWNSRELLGEAVIKYFKLDPSYCSDESLEMVLSEGFAGVSIQLQKIFKAGINDQQATMDQRMEQFIDCCKFACEVLLGVNTVLSPNKTIEDFIWKSPAKVRRGRINLEQIGICPGDLLSLSPFDETFQETDLPLECIVAEGNKVIYDGEIVSLSASALKILCSIGDKSKSTNGSLYWHFKGESLDARRKRIERDKSAAKLKNVIKSPSIDHCRPF